MRDEGARRAVRVVTAERAEARRPDTVEVTFTGGESYRITARGHEFGVDQPLDAGGNDIDPTPVELFVASLAACVGFYAGRYLARHDVPRDGLRVETEFEMADDRPARVASVRMRLTVPPGLTQARTKALLAVVDHCTVHNTLRQPPDVSVEIV